MYKMTKLFSQLYNNDMNKVSKAFVYLLEDFSLQNNEKVRHVIDMTKLKNSIDMLEDNMLKELQEIPVQILDNVFLYNAKEEK